MKKALVLGANGATGRLLVNQLLQKDCQVVAIVRHLNTLIGNDDVHPNLQIIEAEMSSMTTNDLSQYLEQCEAVLCCLGHNLTFKGLFG